MRYQRFRAQIKATRQRAIQLKWKIIKQFKVYKFAKAIRRRAALRRIIWRKVAQEAMMRLTKGVKVLEANMIEKREEEIREAKRREEEARKKAAEAKRLAD